MWERKEADRFDNQTQPVRSETPRMAAAPAFQSKVAHANIGQSLFIKGEVSGSEDLTVDGRVEGRIDLKDHNLTIGPNGKVHADVHAKNITIVGEITGNVVADEKVDPEEVRSVARRLLDEGAAIEAMANRETLGRTLARLW